ncbi:MAG: S46 family peptidase [Flavobacteriia bacterium]|nr:S46 family peptidase [Flavobacteriia bacterium]OJX39860.1 MAG: peptidase [Flavobacteriia bacterium 40-80]
MKRFTLFVVQLFLAAAVFAEEGMLIPSVIDAFENDMKAFGMKLSAKDIYDINNASLKDAIIHFGGGCTAEIVSPQGLILTNHHCGYGQIQQHSSLEKDYLKNGFWAKTLSEELPNPGLTATRIVRIEDVTADVLKGIDQLKDPSEKNAKLLENIKSVKQRMTAGTKFEADIKAFDYGNSYYCLIKETFKDVRLVGTPPNAVGKFGGDTDNWVWPRHTGDFSVFRIYADKDNQPAEYNESNKPYVPLHYLPIAAGKRTAGEFTMVYGFPGITEQHLISNEIQFYMETERPLRIKMRDLSLEVIDAAMRSSDELRIKYAAKQARIANAWKKWIGQLDGLKRLDAVNVKKAYEKTYNETAAGNNEWNSKYGKITARLNQIETEYKAYNLDYALFEEFLYVGPEFFKLIRGFESFKDKYASYEKEGTLTEKRDAYLKSIDNFFKDYDAKIDQAIFDRQFPLFLVNYALPSENAIRKKAAAEWSKQIYGKSIFTEKERLKNFVKNYSPKSDKTLLKDPAIQLYNGITDDFSVRVRPSVINYNTEKNALLKLYVEGKYIMFPNEKHWPDANSTLRITYGKLEGSQPKDGISYVEHTTVDGILEKYQTGNPDFELLPELVDFYNKKEYGDYAQDGEMWVCFTGSNHTTGGNSGSPVINAEGFLMGLNFDRSWESTMSDFIFDPTRCRNIVVDIRYVLWIMEKYAGATRLINEMDIRR